MVLLILISVCRFFVKLRIFGIQHAEVLLSILFPKYSVISVQTTHRLHTDYTQTIRPHCTHKYICHAWSTRAVGGGLMAQLVGVNITVYLPLYPPPATLTPYSAANIILPC